MSGVNIGGRAASDADRLLDQAATIWLTLESCRDKADDGTRAMIDDAIAALEEVAALARMLRDVTPGHPVLSCLGDLCEADELACAIYERVQGAATEDP
jgi:hypothetical protein